jgi:hypothetical protein
LTSHVAKNVARHRLRTCLLIFPTSEYSVVKVLIRSKQHTLIGVLVPLSVPQVRFGSTPQTQVIGGWRRMPSVKGGIYIVTCIGIARNSEIGLVGHIVRMSLQNLLIIDFQLALRESHIAASNRNTDLPNLEESLEKPKCQNPNHHCRLWPKVKQVWYLQDLPWLCQRWPSRSR